MLAVWSSSLGHAALLMWETYICPNHTLRHGPIIAEFSVMGIFSRILIPSVLFFLVACNSRFEPKAIQHKSSTNGEYLTNKSGQVLTQEVPLLVALDETLPATLKEGCQNSIEQINASTGLILLRKREDSEAKPIVTIRFGTVESLDPTHQAHTDLDYDGQFITAVSIVFDEQYEFSLSPTQNEFDSQSVCLHELGHALGLTHSENVESMMFYGLKNSQLRREPAPEDIAKIMTIYGK